MSVCDGLLHTSLRTHICASRPTARHQPESTAALIHLVLTHNQLEPEPWPRAEELFYFNIVITLSAEHQGNCVCVKAVTSRKRGNSDVNADRCVTDLSRQRQVSRGTRMEGVCVCVLSL